MILVAISRKTQCALQMCEIKVLKTDSPDYKACIAAPSMVEKWIKYDCDVVGDNTCPPLGRGRETLAIYLYK